CSTADSRPRRMPPPSRDSRECSSCPSEHRTNGRMRRTSGRVRHPLSEQAGTMTTTAPVPTATTSPRRMPYAALLAMMAMSFLLVSAEFLPNGVLTEIAAELGVTPGQAGQLVTVTALAGL